MWNGNAGLQSEAKVAYEGVHHTILYSSVTQT